MLTSARQVGRRNPRRFLRRTLSSAVGAVLLLGAAALAPAAAASFDCATAGAADEKAVCADCDLAQLDVKMATLYEVVTRLVAMGQRGDIQDAQRTFLAERARCGADTACLSRAYRARIGVLEQAFSAIAARGPF